VQPEHQTDDGCCSAKAKGSSDDRQTAELVRAKIERGESSDKIGGFDPAAAPLGTDDEAAGVPTHPVEEDANPGGAQVRRNQFRRE
jgi:hypothetical protein